MRGFLICLAATFVLAISTPAHANVVKSSSVPSVSSPSTNRGGGGKWYANPMWIAIGAVAAIVVLLLVVLAARGGGTTIVKE